MEPLEKKFKDLPEELKGEVIDFIDFLMSKKKNQTIKSNKKLKLDWAGDLKDLKDKYTSIELQKKSWEWID